jgi:hypothetical protein
MFMRKFIAILCVLVLLPLCAFAAGSPTGAKIITSKPKVNFILAEKTEDNWQDIIARLDEVKDETEGYVLLDALFIFINNSHEKVEWQLSIPITLKHEPFALMIDSEAIVRQEVEITKDGKVIIDFTNYETGVYYLLFYIKGA